MSDSIQFGWGAPSFAEQLPALPKTDAEHFDLDNKAIIRLSVRGYISESQRDQVIRRVTRSIEGALALAAEAEGRDGVAGSVHEDAATSVATPQTLSPQSKPSSQTSCLRESEGVPPDGAGLLPDGSAPSDRKPSACDPSRGRAS